MNNPTIREFTGFKTLKEATISMFNEAADIIEMRFYTENERQEWGEKCWDDYGDDLVEFLHGNLDEKFEDCDDDDLIDYCTINELTDAIKANSENIFGYDITDYLEN